MPLLGPCRWRVDGFRDPLAAKRVAARALDEAPQGLVDALAPQLGEDAEPFFRGLVVHLRSRRAAQALAEQLDGWPSAQALVRLVLAGMV